MNKVQQLAKEAQAYFEFQPATRRMALAPKAPEWVYDMTQQAFGGFPADDPWRMSWVVDTLDLLAAYGDTPIAEQEMAKESFADKDLVEWFASHADRVAAVDEVRSDLDDGNIPILVLIEVALRGERYDTYNRVVEFLLRQKPTQKSAD